MSNPGGDGRVAERIVEILDSAPLGEELSVKPAVPLDSPG